MIKQFDLTDEQVDEIHGMFSTINSLKSLAREEFNKTIAESIIEKLITAQQDYDAWFRNIESSLDVSVTPQNSWEVDFDNKKLILH
jgi:CXXX repeat modification system protein